MNEVQTSDFDYSLVSNEFVEYLKEQEYILVGIQNKYAKEVGRVFCKAQQKFSDFNNGGLFEKWYSSKGFKKQNVYNYINIYNEVQNLDGDQLENFNKAPKSLQIETSKKSVDPELKEQVLSGDITTNKQYKEMEEAKRLAEKQAEQAQESEQTAIRQLEEERNKEPREIVKEVVPSEVKQQLESKDRILNFTSKENNRLQQEVDSYKLKDTSEFDEEQAEYELKKLNYEADRNTVEIRVAFKQLNDRISVSRYLDDAIMASGDYEKKKLQEEVGITERIINDIKTALKGRKEIEIYE